MTDVLSANRSSGREDQLEWIDVCDVDAVTPDRGIAALVAGVAVAIFRLATVQRGDETVVDETWFAVDHLDPQTGAPVMARGLVGSLMIDGVEVSTVASPIHKQRYDLRTGTGLGGEATSLRTWQVEIVGRRVMVATGEMSPA